ncbi:phosphatases II [Backusella circina FSU 941]|nr:phosphatases II [Backusella circina FSU 941]
MTFTETKRLSLLPPSGLANRRRNNKNLSLCLSSDAPRLFDSPKTASLIPPEQNRHAYPDGPVKIMDRLYLGSEENTLDLEHLGGLNIQAILNVAAEVNNPYEYLFQPMDSMLAQVVVPSPSLSNASSIDSESSIKTISSFSHISTAVGYQKLPWEHNQDNLVIELQKAIDIIDRAREAGQTILVHCQCGVARSATVIIAYTMKTLKLPMQEAYTHVKSIASAISPNLGLLFQLREFEQSLFHSRVVNAKIQTNEEEAFSSSCIPETVQARPIGTGRPKSWVGPNTPVHTIKKKPSGFTLRTSSLSAWKRKITEREKSSKEEKGWWSPRKLSIENTSVCC